MSARARRQQKVPHQVLTYRNARTGEGLARFDFPRRPFPEDDHYAGQRASLPFQPIDREIFVILAFEGKITIMEFVHRANGANWLVGTRR